jgi:hypothetical protein
MALVPVLIVPAGPLAAGLQGAFQGRYGAS